MNVTLYKFAKRQNSTLRPSSGTASFPITNAKINDGATSILNPSIRLGPISGVTETGLLYYNYAHISDFQRYYYINNWIYNGDGTWTAEMEIDYLASWLTEIRASGGYIGRSSVTSLADYWVADSLYPATTDFAVKTATGTTGFNPDVGSGTYVIGVVSGQSPNVGSVSYYITTSTQMNILVQNIVGNYGTDPNAFSNITNLDSDVLKSLVNPIQYIVSCKWFPFGASREGIATTSKIYLWGWDTGAVGYKLIPERITQKYPNVNGVEKDGELWNFIHLPELETGDVPNYSLTAYPPYAPYAKYNLITAWGTFDLDPNIISNMYFHHQPWLYYRFVVNMISGTGSFIVGCIPYKETGTGTASAQPFTELFRRDVELGLDIPLSQVSYNYVNVGHTALNAAQSAVNAGFWGFMTGGASLVTGGITDVAHNVIDAAAASLSPSIQSTGAQAAAFTQLITSMKYQMIRYRTITKDANTLGNPVKKHVSSLGVSFSGFVQFDISEFTGNDGVNPNRFCTGAEKAEVKHMLELGVFVE